MPLTHLTPEQWDAVDASTPDQETRDHLKTCKECRAVIAESRALLVGLRTRGHKQESGPPPGDHLSPNDLAEYADGALFDADTTQFIEEHLERCSDCRDDIIVMRDVVTAGDLNEVVPAAVRKQLLERLSRASQFEPATSLGAWLVRASRKAGAVFSPVAAGRMAAASAATMMAASLKIAHARQGELMEVRLALEQALHHARERVEQARVMMARATDEMRDLSLQFEQVMRLEHRGVAELAEAQAEAERAATTMPADLAGPLLELTAADLRLLIEAKDPERPDVLTMTLVTEAGDPVPGVALELHSPDGKLALRTSDEHGQASFSLERGESTLRMVRVNGSWELQLARRS
jgi:hypothetical protein